MTQRYMTTAEVAARYDRGKCRVLAWQQHGWIRAVNHETRQSTEPWLFCPDATDLRMAARGIYPRHDERHVPSEEARGVSQQESRDRRADREAAAMDETRRLAEMARVGQEQSDGRVARLVEGRRRYPSMVVGR